MVASGATDAEAPRRAREEGRLLLTEDRDFGELVFRSKSAVPGLVLLRVDAEYAFLKWTRLESAIGKFGDSLFGRYVVIEEARFRSRPLRGSAHG